MTDEFETSLQVLRGFDTDISVEVNEIKVITNKHLSVFFQCILHDPHFLYFVTIKCIL